MILGPHCSIRSRFLGVEMERVLVRYGSTEIKIRDPYDQRYVALIIRQESTMNNKNSKINKVKYEFKRGYTKESLLNALIYNNKE